MYHHPEKKLVEKYAATDLIAATVQCQIHYSDLPDDHVQGLFEYFQMADLFFYFFAVDYQSFHYRYLPYSAEIDNKAAVGYKLFGEV